MLTEKKNLPRTDKCVKIACINVCGLVNKLKYPDFLEKINMYDIIGFSETKLRSDRTDPVDTNSIDNFTIFHKFRKHKNFNSSGGLSVAFRNQHVAKIKMLNCNNDDMIWLQLGTSIDPLLVLFIYNPPESSPYAQPDFFNTLEMEILVKRNISNNIIIMGDFNAHTKEAADYITDNNLMNPHESYLKITVQTEEVLTRKNIPLTRINIDTNAINNWGRKLIELCNK